ncbi:MAG: peptide chain release factor 3 [Pseudomonadota bacterium]
MTMNDEIHRRRTFAIISHPDAGKTTLTEKLLLFGGAIQQAGAVKARRQMRLARSDWMKVEQERGISVVSSVMTFDYEGIRFNLLDTPGHEDFSEDTYRTLTAVDSAIMVIDHAKGIEPQTRKLFEVCRLRDMPIITFINKLDREGLNPFDLLDEIEQKLALDITPASWPVGMGKEFLGCYDLPGDQLMLMERTKGDKIGEGVQCRGLEDPKLSELLPQHAADKLREDVAMVRAVCKPFDRKAYLGGHMSPVFFGSALNNFGVRELLEGLQKFAPPPRPQPADGRMIETTENKVTGFVFKIQANMDPKHRDRIAFTRICSGHFRRGMKLKHVRTGKLLTVHNPMLFFAQEREVAENACAGDIIGIPNHGILRIGDTLTEGEDIHVVGIPSFAPEHLQRVRLDDPLRAKHLGQALLQLAEEGAARIFKPRMDSSWVAGVVGPLQFDILADRIRTEYNLPVHFEETALHTARWLESDSRDMLDRFMEQNLPNIADDHDGHPVFLARNAWHLGNAVENWPQVRFLATKEQARA